MKISTLILVTLAFTQTNTCLKLEANKEIATAQTELPDIADLWQKINMIVSICFPNSVPGANTTVPTTPNTNIPNNQPNLLDSATAANISSNCMSSAQSGQVDNIQDILYTQDDNFRKVATSPTPNIDNINIMRPFLNLMSKIVVLNFNCQAFFEARFIVPGKDQQPKIKAILSSYTQFLAEPKGVDSLFVSHKISNRFADPGAILSKINQASAGLPKTK